MVGAGAVTSRDGDGGGVDRTDACSGGVAAESFPCDGEDVPVPLSRRVATAAAERFLRKAAAEAALFAHCCLTRMISAADMYISHTLSVLDSMLVISNISLHRGPRVPTTSSWRVRGRRAAPDASVELVPTALVVVRSPTPPSGRDEYSISSNGEHSFSLR